MWRILCSASPDLCPIRFHSPYDTWQEWGLANVHLIPVDADTIVQQTLAAPATLLHARRQLNEETLVHAVDTPAHRARMHSLKCRHSGAFLDTVPVTPYLRLADDDFIAGCHFRLGATGTNPHIPAVTCYCGRHVQGNDIDHAMSCYKVSGGKTRRHDHWKAALSRVTHRAGASHNIEPEYNDIGVAAPGRPRARADVTARMPPPYGNSVLDVSITHPRGASVIGVAAQSPGAAAAKRDQDKYRSHQGHQHPGYTFVPASVETYGFLGKPLVRYLNDISAFAASKNPSLSKGSFLASVYRELSVALVRSQGYVYRSCAALLAKAGGRQFVAGAEFPFVD